VSFLKRNLISLKEPDEVMTLTLDASPWGLGAILSHDNCPIVYFASKLTALDEEMLSFEIGSSAAQQICTDQTSASTFPAL